MADHSRTLVLATGKRRITVDVDAYELLVAVKPDSFYRLGEPLNSEVILGDIIANLCPVQWCSAVQEWVSVK